jgi:hypothetical protein
MFIEGYISQMITETPFPYSIVRTLAQGICTDMRTISDLIADTNDPIERDELLARLILCQGSLALIYLAVLREDHFFIQRAADLSR